MPVPAGMRRPTMTFSLRPRRWSTRPATRRFGEDARGLLEGRRGDERAGREGRFGDAEEERDSVRRLAAAVHDLFVLFHEAETIDLLIDEEIGIADARHANAAQHLTADDFDVLVVDLHRLRAVDLLDLVDQVA